MKIIFVADFFASDIPGGGELNNEEIMSLLEKQDCQIIKYHSSSCSLKEIQSHPDSFFIIANFVSLSEIAKQYLIKHCLYIIYEHDYKYLRSRNPALYPNYKVPQSQIINLEFYQKAKAVLCQSSFHKNIIQQNLKIDNLINLSGNAWPDEILDYISELNKRFPISQKLDLWSIMGSGTPHKNTKGAIEFCELNKYAYKIIPPLPYKNFLFKLAKNKHFVFLPQTPETLSRIAVESKMLDIELEIGDNVGAKWESWFTLSGDELISFMKQKKHQIVSTILEIVNENTSRNKQNT